MSCQTCQDEAIANYISIARGQAQEQGISGETITILERVNGTGYFWVRDGDERIERLKVVGREWIS